MAKPPGVQIIRKRIADAGFLQTDVAAHLGLPDPIYCNILSGVRRATFLECQRLAHLLALPLTEVLDHLGFEYDRALLRASARQIVRAR